jgi:uncharacterized protein (DUF1800 family)
MTSAVVYTYLFIHLGIILVVTAYYAVGAMLAPGMTARARIRFARRPWLPVLVGLACSVPWVLAAILLLNAASAPLRFAGATIGCLWVLAGLLGGAGIAQHVGGPRDADDVTWVHSVRGGLFISLTWILPLVGWLGMLPLTLAAGVGCLLLGVVPMRRDAVGRGGGVRPTTVSPSRRSFVRLIGLGGATAALGGCDAAADALARLAGTHVEVDFTPPAADAIDLPAHVLARLTWGARPGDHARVHRMGVDAFIEEQLDPASIDDRRCAWRVASIESLAEPTGELYEYDPDHLLDDLTQAKILRGVRSRRQLFEVMVDFWTDHFNIVSGKGQCRWLKAADDRDVVRAHALGRFQTLVRASAVSPAMLIYLDGHDNRVERPGDRPNENYARELLELHTLGVDGGYTQRDVMEVARCLSGWTYRHEPFKLRAAHVEFDPRRHDDRAKEVLGHAIPAGGGADDLERVLDIVCAHPSTATHLATRLVRRFVADPAPDEAVRATAAAFTASGGNITRTLRALFSTPAFREHRGNLLKRPLRFVLSALRATGARTNGRAPIVEMLQRMGHAPFQYPNPDGYPLEAEPWLGTLLWRWNFALRLETGGFRGTSIDRAALTARLGGLDATAAHVLGRRPTPLERDVIQETTRPLALLLASPAFQRH